MNRATLAKSLRVNCDIEEGEVVEAHMVEVKSPGTGAQPNRMADFVGQPAKRSFSAGDVVYLSDLAPATAAPRAYSFARPWGLPVRYHDYRDLLALTNPDFLEFHLSYKDMTCDLHKFFAEEHDLGLVVHSPDVFAGDHILDPSSPEDSVRTRSLQELQKVIEITRSLKGYFRKAVKPFVVVSAGGYTRRSHMPASERRERYRQLAEALACLDAEGVELLPQTLPPFPWYFGGQLFLNLFVDPEDSSEFCREYGYRVCMDVCHSKLACNHFGWSFKEYVDKLGPYTAHIHISDARGTDGEGLQIGDGDVDFSALAGDLARTSPGASFIPEIWQGHENNGEGFWLALERLEGKF